MNLSIKQKKSSIKKVQDIITNKGELQNKSCLVNKHLPG